MTRNLVSVRQVDAADPDARVCHIDQLGTEAKVRFPSLVDSDDPVAVPETVRAGLERFEYVKFNQYYHVETNVFR